MRVEINDRKKTGKSISTQKLKQQTLEQLLSERRNEKNELEDSSR
jgi:hypothetical protein